MSKAKAMLIKYRNLIEYNEGRCLECDEIDLEHAKDRGQCCKDMNGPYWHHSPKCKFLEAISEA